MISRITDNLLSQLKIDEQSGRVALTAYLCPAGHWTIGWGHNLEAHPDPDYPAKSGTTCSPEQADIWLREDAQAAERQMLNRWPWMQDLPQGVYEACVNLAFNMGAATFSNFTNTLRCLSNHDWDGAAHNLEQSHWYAQVGDRARRVVAQVKRGV